MNKKFLSIGYILVFLGILVAVNFISSMLFVKLDLSPQKMYSVSPATKRVLGRLEDNLIFRVYFTKNLPNPYGANGRYLRDFLEEYRGYSGKIKFSFVDPAQSDKLKQEAQLAGVMPIRFTSVEKDKLELKEGYMGLSIRYKDKLEVIPYLKDTDGLEYEITGRIKKLINPVKKNVGFLAGHQENNPADIPEFRKFIEEQYNYKTVDSAKEEALSSDLDCLVIAGPKTRLSEYELYLIDQFVMKGKPVGIFFDNYEVSLENFFARKIDSGLSPILTSYGVIPKTGLVLDYQCQRIGIRSQQGFFVIQNYVDYPYVPVAATFNNESPIVKSFEKMSLPFVSPLEVSLSTAAAKERKFTPLIYSSKASWYQDPVYMVNPMQQYKPEKNSQVGPFILAATVEGKLDSYYRGAEIPKRIAEKNEAGKKLVLAPQARLDRAENARLMISGSGAMLKSEFITDPACLNYFMNTLDWLSQDFDLLGIRNKGFVFRPLSKVSDAGRLAYKYGNLILLPLLVIAYGIFRWKARKILIARRIAELIKE